MDTKQLETKQTKVLPFEIKSVYDEGTFEGYGSVFGNKDSYGDVVEPGAFAKSLAENKPKDIKLLWQHDMTQPIGVYTDIKEDSRGLCVKGQLCMESPRGKEAHALMKMGALSGLSIGYMINKGGAKYNPATETLHLTSLNLMEVSVVTFPANASAQISAVKEFDLTDVRKLEHFLRDAGGYSLKEAKIIASRCFKAPLRDVDALDDDEGLKHLLDNLSKSILDITKLKEI